MQKEFIPYEQALALKELGFNEECIRYFDKSSNQQLKTCEEMHNGNSFNYIVTPLYQQVFRWFREKYELYQAVYADKRADDLTLLYKVHVYKLDEELSEYAYRWAKTYEEAELACLKELIKIIQK